MTEVVALPSGQALVRLSWRDDGGVWREEGLRRLNADGSLDRAFQPAHTGVRAVAAARDGAAFVVTLSNPPPGQPPLFELLRLRPDGTADSAFAARAGAFAHIDALAVQPDGKVLVAGRRRADALDLGVFRLSPDGGIDPSFGDGGRAAVNGFVRRVLAGADGAVYLVGDFVDVGAGGARLPRYQIARLTADGKPDPSFDPR